MLYLSKDSTTKEHIMRFLDGKNLTKQIIIEKVLKQDKHNLHIMYILKVFIMIIKVY